MVEVLKKMATSFKRSQASTATFGAPNTSIGTANPCLHRKLWETHRQAWVSLLWGIDHRWFSSVQFNHSVLSDSLQAVNSSMPGLGVHYQILEFTQTNVHWVSDAIQPFHSLSSPSPPALTLSQHQGIFKWVSSAHQVVKILEFQLQYQSFQWTCRTDLL